MKETNYSRRRFLSDTAISLAGTELAMLGLSTALFANHNLKEVMNNNYKENSFYPIKQINAGVLNIVYAEEGPVDGSPVILLHDGPTTFTLMMM